VKYQDGVTEKGRPNVKVFAADYRTGMHFTDVDPLGVIDSLAQDAKTGRDYVTLADFIADFGYDDDWYKAEELLDACKKAERELRAWCKTEAMWDDFLSVEY
jgi:hypothetical protein